MGIFDALGLLFPSFGDPVQKRQDLVSGKAFDASFPEILIKPGEERLV